MSTDAPSYTCYPGQQPVLATTFQSPPVALEPWVKKAFIHWPSAVPPEYRQRYSYRMPQGTAHVMFVRWHASPSEDGRVALWASGPQTSLFMFPVERVQMAVGLEAKTGGLATLLGCPAMEVTNRLIDLEHLWGREGAQLLESLALTPLPHVQLDLLSQFVMRKVIAAADRGFYATAAADLIEREQGRLTVRDLACRLGYSERQVRRQFANHLGLTPKEYCRAVRLHAVCKAGLARGMDWARIALEYSYFDQAHLIHDFRKMLCCTPEQFVGLVAPQYAHLLKVNVVPFTSSFPSGLRRIGV